MTRLRVKGGARRKILLLSIGSPLPCGSGDLFCRGRRRFAPSLRKPALPYDSIRLRPFRRIIQSFNPLQEPKLDVDVGVTFRKV